MSCERHTGAIVDHACGAEIAADAAAHLRRLRVVPPHVRRAAAPGAGDRSGAAAGARDRAVGAIRARRPGARGALGVRRWRTVMWWGAPAAAAAALILVMLGWPRLVERQPSRSTRTRGSRPTRLQPRRIDMPPAVEPVPSEGLTSRSSDGRRAAVAAAASAAARPSSSSRRSRRSRVMVPAGTVAGDRALPDLVRRGALDTSTLVSSEGPAWDAPGRTGHRAALCRRDRHDGCRKQRSVPASIDADRDCDKERGA